MSSRKAGQFDYFCAILSRNIDVLMHFLRKYYVILLWALFFMCMANRVWFNTRAVIWSDAEGYYAYNPTWFILGDVHKMPAESAPHIKTPNGENLNKYTCGVALLQLPFFWATRIFCLIADQQPNEIFSMHYGRSTAVAGYTFGFLGLFLLDRALRRKFSGRVAVLTVLSVFLGTNLHYYMTAEPGMSHAYSFFLFAFVVWWLPRVYQETVSLRNVAILAAALGLIVLIRPTSILILLFVLGFETDSWAQVGQRLKWWFGQPKVLAVGLCAAVLSWLPQMWYWYQVTGRPFIYSYTNEAFIYWKRPKIGAVLFDTQNGLFLYSPLALLMVIPLFIFTRDTRACSRILIPIFGVATYLFASWWAWWFGGAFGHRCYVEFYALLAWPLAVLIESALKWKLVPRILFFMLLAFLWYYGLKLSYLYSELPRPWDGADWRWNFEKIVEIWRHLF